MSGDVKSQQLETLRTNIKNLADTMGIEYKDNESNADEAESFETQVDNTETEIQSREEE